MAYADQQMSGNKIIAIIIVVLIHLAVGYVLITGLAYSAAQKVIERVTTVDIDEPPPPEPEDEPPPPPPEPETAPPPPVAPPPPINVSTKPPQIETQINIPPPAPPAVIVPPPAAPAPPPPPPPRFDPKPAEPRNNPGTWATPNDYPSRALREEREGVTRFRVTVGTNGRVENCTIIGSSGHPDLDEATCKNVTRRARFRPAKDGNGNETTGSYTSAVRWVIPD
ncbi:energy transducer TonB [Altericroceibacterium spongiae]|uniref:Energy transducer TonB n=1 Tax=Altericroceibacterium spongiae TaxID=2320269 RepID=A0A420EIL8_9SPHN|nr:energy transducer TonB [Altericroceibacterium spongiae]RKF20545.1 energy transducer TonB [Altericroceibacterium spongiae]